MSGFQMGIFIEHSIAYLSGMMFLRCNRTHQGTLASCSPLTPMRLDVRPTSSACLLENNYGGRVGCFGMTSSYCGPSRKSHNTKALEQLSVPRKRLVILSNEIIHLFNRASQGALSKFRKAMCSQKQRRGCFSSSKPRSRFNPASCSLPISRMGGSSGASRSLSIRHLSLGSRACPRSGAAH